MAGIKVASTELDALDDPRGYDGFFFSWTKFEYATHPQRNGD